MTVRKNRFPIAERRQKSSLSFLLGLSLLASATYMIPAFAQEDVLRVRLGSDISNFDPHGPSTIENTTFSVHVYDGLFGYNYSDMSLEPRLAESYEVSEDGLTYTIKLRQGVQFHDGYGEFTSDDVLFSFQRVTDPNTGSPWAKDFGGVEFSAPDPYTVELKLAQPNANFLHTLAARNQALILSRKAVEEMGADWITNPVGTGAYSFNTWRPGDRVVLDANPDYFRGAPEIGTVELMVIPEETSAEIALMNREIDVFFALQSPEVIDRLETADGVTIDTRPALISCHLVLNTTVPPLDNVLVRRAMAHAIDRDSLIDSYFQGTKVRTATPLTPEYPEYTDDVPQYPFDPEKAKALLAEAGLADGFDFDYITVALAPYDQFPIVVADDLERVGIRVNLTVMERASYGAARSSGNIPSATTCPSNSPNPDTLLRGLVHSDGFPPGVNTAQYAGADELLDQARATQDNDARIELYRQAQRQIMTDVPTIPLYADRLFTAYQSGIEGVETSAAFWVDVTGAKRTQ